MPRRTRSQTTPPRTAAGTKRRLNLAPWGGIAVLVAVLVVVAIGARALAGGPRRSAVTAGAIVASGPVVSASGVRVDAAQVDLGRVPLNVPVDHAFRVSNDGAAPVQLGRATIEVLEGC